MKKRASVLLALLICLSPWTAGLTEAATTELSYSLAEKLYRQVQSGSGFSGTLTLSLEAKEGREAETIAFAKPWVFELTYIPVPGDGASTERFLELAFKDGEETPATLSAAMKGDALVVRSNLLGEEWFALPRLGKDAFRALSAVSGGDAQSEQAAPASALEETLSQAVAKSPAPALTAFALPLLAILDRPDPAAFEEALTPYLTKVDLWIEAYRQDAKLGKLEDGTTTMALQYEIPASAIKAQAKQMLMDLLSDSALLPMLRSLLPKAYGESLLTPDMQAYYFFAIDEMPLAGALTIDRTVSVRGDTLALHIELPLYDETAGEITLAYDRKAGARNDLPDENEISLESGSRRIRLAYQEYSSMTGVTVCQGTLRAEPLSGAEAQDAPDSVPPSVLSAAFTLSGEDTLSTDSDGFETLKREYRLTLEPLFTDAGGRGEALLTAEEKAAFVAFPAVDLEVSAVFKSKPEQIDPTYIDLTATLTGDALPATLALAFTGKTRAPWLPQSFDSIAATDMADMTEAELTAFVTQTGLRTGLCFLPYLTLPASAGEGTGGQPESQ